MTKRARASIALAILLTWLGSCSNATTEDVTGSFSLDLREVTGCGNWIVGRGSPNSQLGRYGLLEVVDVTDPQSRLIGGDADYLSIDFVPDCSAIVAVRREAGEVGLSLFSLSTFDIETWLIGEYEILGEIAVRAPDEVIIPVRTETGSQQLVFSLSTGSVAPSVAHDGIVGDPAIAADGSLVYSLHFPGAQLSESSLIRENDGVASTLIVSGYRGGIIGPGIAAVEADRFAIEYRAGDRSGLAYVKLVGETEAVFSEIPDSDGLLRPHSWRARLPHSLLAFRSASTIGQAGDWVLLDDVDG